MRSQQDSNKRQNFLDRKGINHDLINNFNDDYEDDDEDDDKNQMNNILPK